jgi:hypothetical protein
MGDEVAVMKLAGRALPGWLLRKSGFILPIPKLSNLRGPAAQMDGVLVTPGETTGMT